MTTRSHVPFLAGLAALPLSFLAALSAQEPVRVSAGTGEKYDLRIASAKDASAWFKTKIVQAQQIDMAGQQLEANITTELILDAKVLGKNEDGSLTVEVQIAAVRGSAEVPMMGESSFD